MSSFHGTYPSAEGKAIQSFTVESGCIFGLAWPLSQLAMHQEHTVLCKRKFQLVQPRSYVAYLCRTLSGMHDW